MAAIADIWHSERGFVAVALIIAATVLAALAVISGADWITYTSTIFGIYATTKTVTGAVEAWKGDKSKDNSQ